MQFENLWEPGNCSNYMIYRSNEIISKSFILEKKRKDLIDLYELE